jgi:hypothetical protein
VKRWLRKWGDIDGEADPLTSLTSPLIEVGLVGQVTPAPWGASTPPLNGDPSDFLAAMRAAMSAGREAEEARARSRISAAPRRSLRRVF